MTYCRHCNWRIKLPVGYQVVVNILDIDIVDDPGPAQVGYALSVNNMYMAVSNIYMTTENIYTII